MIRVNLATLLRASFPHISEICCFCILFLDWIREKRVVIMYLDTDFFFGSTVKALKLTEERINSFYCHHFDA